MTELFEKTVGPVVFENNPVKICRAFELGCSGVIVDGDVPMPVTMEIARAGLGLTGNTVPDFIENAMQLDCYGPDQEGWYWPDTIQGFKETRLWIKEKVAGFIQSGLRQTFSKIAAGPFRKPDHKITVWSGNQFLLPWHIDESDPRRSPDIHLHIYGPGMKIASPRQPTALKFNRDRELFTLAKAWPGQNSDDMLREKGFEILSLKPGQTLLFREQCLHESSPTDARQMKLRGAIFDGPDNDF